MSTRRLPLAADEPSRPLASPAPLAVGLVKDADLLQVGDLAKATGKTVRAIHLYEELGLVPRSRALERALPPVHERRADPRPLDREAAEPRSLALGDPRARARARRLRFRHGRRAEAQGSVRRAPHRNARKIEELRELEAELKDSLAYLTACDSACESQIPVHSCPSCDRHPERPQAPELVTAVHVV